MRRSVKKKKKYCQFPTDEYAANRNDEEINTRPRHMQEMSARLRNCSKSEDINNGDCYESSGSSIYSCIYHYYLSTFKLKVHPVNRPRRSRGGVNIYLYTFCNLGARLGVVNAASRLLYPRQRPSARGWVGPMACMDGCEKSRPYRYSIPGPSSPQRVLIPIELSRPTLSAYTEYRNYSPKKILPCAVQSC